MTNLKEGAKTDLEEGAGGKMGGISRLTPALVSAEHPGQDLATITSLKFTKRGIKEIVGLDAFEKLTRLDLSNNSLASLEGLALCTNLKWLSVAGNCLQSLKGIEGLYKLTVLNASHNELTSIEEVACLTNLRALILNDNNLTSLCKLDQLTSLNALALNMQNLYFMYELAMRACMMACLCLPVLSQNPLRDLGKSLAKMSSMTKLSLSYCRLQTIGASLRHCVALKELRLAHNQLMSLPLDLEQNRKLQILDLGHNHLRQWSDILVLGVLHELRNLNLQGNSVYEDIQYQDKIKELLPNLQILDGHLIERNQKYFRVSKKLTEGTNSVRESRGNVLKDTCKSLGPHESKGHEINSRKSTKKSKNEDKEGIKIEKTGSDENGPFIDVIFFQGKTTESNVDETVKGRKRNLEDANDSAIPKAKMDSGVVAILDGNKTSREPRRKIHQFGPKFLQNLTEIEIGTGGPSTWEIDPVESKPQAPQMKADVSSQSTYSLSGSSYSRWRLKGPRKDN